MSVANYEQRRAEIEHYFDRTAADTWATLTSDAPVSRIRQTVRAGRDDMRSTLLSWLPEDLTGRRILDAGCGTGALSLEAAQRGAEVVAIDLSPTLIKFARQRIDQHEFPGRIAFEVGDMRHFELGQFDHVVAMDSLIHYAPDDGIRTLESLAASVGSSVLFTFAPKTPLLATMHAMGQWFPRADRSPAIVPVSERALAGIITQSSEFMGWHLGRRHRVHRGFYISHAMEVRRQ